MGNQLYLEFQISITWYYYFIDYTQKKKGSRKFGRGISDIEKSFFII